MIAAPRILAGLLALVGGYWAIRLLSYFTSPISALVVLPGFLIWALWIWRAFCQTSKPVFIAGWLFAMVWHLAIGLVAPLLSALMQNAPFIREYAGAAGLISLAGLLLETRAQKPSVLTENNKPRFKSEVQQRKLSE